MVKLMFCHEVTNYIKTSILDIRIHFTKKILNILLVAKKTFIDISETAVREFIYLLRQLIMNIAVEPKHGFVVVVLLFVLINGGTRHNLAYIDFAVLYGIFTPMLSFK